MESLADRLAWFKDMILPHEAVLHARLRRILRDADRAEDLAAEVLTRAYAAPTFDTIQSGRVYLFRIARNLLIDEARREKVVSFDVMADLDFLLVDEKFEATLQARDELRWLSRVIETLPPQCRQVFVMRRVLDRSVREIADTLGLSVSTVEKHLTKGVTRLMHAVRAREECEVGRIEREGVGQAEDRRGGGATRR